MKNEHEIGGAFILKTKSQIKTKIEIGKEYYKWTVIGEAGKDKFGRRMVLCRCSCGKINELYINSLKNGKSKGCSICSKQCPSVVIAKIGSKWGQLTVIAEAERDEQGRRRFFCKCSCGNSKVVDNHRLTRGKTKTCGECTVNRYEINGDVVTGFCASGAKFEVNKRHYDLIKQFRWAVNDRGCVWTNTHKNDGFKTKKIYIHRLIMQHPKGQNVDHIDGNPSNNLDSNLRICSQSQNSKNKSTSKKNTSGYKGVSFDKDRKLWKAQIGSDDRKYFIGRYHTKNAASHAYDEKARELHDEYATLNFPLSGEQNCRRNTSRILQTL